MLLNRTARILLLTAITLLLLLGGVIVSGKPVAASSPSRDTYYRTIRIEDGDTLWSIASEYTGSSDTLRIQEYINSLKQMNHITNEHSLKAGSYLTVSYTSDHMPET